MSENYTEAVNVARDYYNSTDADNFYFNIWGGEDLHLGIYNTPDESIFDASRRMVQRMASKIPKLDESTPVLDLGGGYGGSMRYLARTYGCPCTVLNLSEVENERDRKMNKEQGLDHLMTVLDGDFANVPCDDESFSVVWSQDAILHSDDRRKVLSEAARVLVPGGTLVFTDPMQKDDAPTDKLQPIYDRIQLESLASPGFYEKTGKEMGLEFVEFENHEKQLPLHYGRVREELINREDELHENVSDEYIQNMKKGLQHWVDGGNNGYLTWGVFVFRKPE